MRPRRARLPAVLLVTLMLTSLIAACGRSDGAAVRIESLNRGGPSTGRRGDAKDTIRIAAPPGLHEGIGQAIEYAIEQRVVEPTPALRVVDDWAPAELRVHIEPYESDAPVIRRWSVVTAAARIDVSAVPLPVVMQASKDGALFAAHEHVPFVNAMLGGRVGARGIGRALIPARLDEQPDALAIVPVDEVTVRVRALALDGVDPVRGSGDLSQYALVTRGRIEPSRSSRNLEGIVGGLAQALATDGPPPVRISFTGDVIPARCVYDRMVGLDDWTAPFAAVGERLRASHLTVGSLDAAVSNRGTPIGCRETYSLIAPSRVTEGFQQAGYDVLSVATNHVKDCGAIAGCGDTTFLDTLTHLRDAGIAPVGGGLNLAAARRPVIVRAGGTQFAFLAYDDIASYYHAGEQSPGTAPLDLTTIAADIRAARAIADVVVVLPQWGEEYTAHPTARQREVARRAIEAGAALVVGNHPHVVQAAAPLDDGYVAYALGNFVFDQDWSQETTEGVVLEATFRGSRLTAVHMHPVSIRDRLQPVFTSPEAGRSILLRIMAAAAKLAK